jgi:hypothetical protein
MPPQATQGAGQTEEIAMKEIYTCDEYSFCTTLIQVVDGSLVVRNYVGSAFVVRPGLSAEEARDILHQIYCECKPELRAEAEWNAWVDRQAKTEEHMLEHREKAFCRFWFLLSEALKA